jgi:UDP-GlcNAc:undecaprenyl-phosphate GlcNAc-1-phosphate transferase
VRQYSFSFGVALAGSLILTFLVRAAARRLKLVAKPRADRWHKKPTALFGGVAMYLSFALVYVLRRPAELQGDALFMACATGMFLVGLIDDFVQLKPYSNLVGQIDCSIRRLRSSGWWVLPMR